jgi:hypothetical protein
MDINFKCPNCDQELEVDASGAGSTLQCPSCFISITVPSAGAEAAPSPMAKAPAVTPPPVEKHFSVPVHDVPTDALIQKPNRPLEVAAKESDKRMRIKTIKRTDCQEVGKDRFDEKVSDFLEHVGQANIISINTINYSMIDMSTHAQLEDYGVMVVYRG